MASITIRNLEDGLKGQLRVRAALQGESPAREHLADSILGRFAAWPAETAARLRVMILLDTNVVSELMRAAPAPTVLNWLRAQPSRDIRTIGPPIINPWEAYRGPSTS